MYLTVSNQSDETRLFFMINDHELYLRPFHAQSSLVKNENSTKMQIESGSRILDIRYVLHQTVYPDESIQYENKIEFRDWSRANMR